MCQQLSHCRGKAFIKSISLDHCGPLGLISTISHEGPLPSQNGEEPFILLPPSHSSAKAPASAPQREAWRLPPICLPTVLALQPLGVFLSGVGSLLCAKMCNAGVCTQNSSAEITAKPPTPNPMTEQNLPGGGSFLIKVIIQRAS